MLYKESYSKHCFDRVIVEVTLMSYSDCYSVRLKTSMEGYPIYSNSNSNSVSLMLMGGYNLFMALAYYFYNNNISTGTTCKPLQIQPYR